MNRVYAIRDQKAELYDKPWLERTDDTAKRAFQAAVNNPESPFQAYPEDFTLWHLGTFNDITGDLVPANGGPCQIWTGLEATNRGKNAHVVHRDPGRPNGSDLVPIEA